MPIPSSNSLIDKIKTTWRAQDGETAEEIISKASKVAHFVPRGWEVGKVSNTDAVIFSWAKRHSDKPGDEYSISWAISSDGATLLEEPYAKPMELGWRAFALSLIASEVNEDDKGPCTLGGPVTMDYLPKLDNDDSGENNDDSGEKGDFWLVELYVNCNIAGPKYFTRDGAISFRKYGQGNWKPISFFAHRLDTYAPGTWFDHIEPKEQET